MHSPSTAAARHLVLGAAAVGATVRGLAYAPWSAPVSIRYLSPAEAWMPLSWWATIWIATGIACGISIVWRRLSIAAMSALTGLLTVWGTSYMWAFFFTDAARTWLTGSLLLMGAIWAGVLASMLQRGS